MPRRVILGVACIAATNFSHAADIGISTSGNNISLDYWSSRNASTNLGWYVRALLDFESYENGDEVTVCRDGSVSGSSGSGTCSGHRGVSHSEEAEFDRLGVAIGPTYWVSDKFQLHGGVFFGMYSSNIDIGETGALDYTEVGLDLGVSFKPIESSSFKVVLSHETDQAHTSIGVRFEI